jgi:hypothetical protein
LEINNDPFRQMNTPPSHQTQPTNRDKLAFRLATAADIDAIIVLVNSAYRGEVIRAAPDGRHFFNTPPLRVPIINLNAGKP